jgi:hypothetical protein
MAWHPGEPLFVAANWLELVNLERDKPFSFEPVFTECGNCDQHAKAMPVVWYG